VDTHIEVGRKVASGEADVGLAIMHVAEVYRLNFVPVIWEDFDFVVSKMRLGSAEVAEFLSSLRNELPKIAKDLRGYEVREDVGRILA